MEATTTENRALPIRISQFPTLEKCWPSAILAAQMPGSSSTAADAGTQFHKDIAAHIRGESPDIAAMDADRKYLYFAGLSILDEIAQYIGAAKPNVERTVYFLGDVSGHPDLDWTVSADDAGLCYALDWKSGRKDGNYSAQIKGYLAAIATPTDYEPGLLRQTRYFGIIAWVRERTWECYEFNERLMLEWSERMKDQIVKARTETPKIADYTTGDHCSTCRAAAICPAWKTALSAMNWTSKIDLADYNDARLIELRRVRTIAKRFIDWFDEALNIQVAARGKLADETVEFTMEPSERVSIRSDNAVAEDVAKVLRSFVSQEQLNDATKIGKTAIVDAVKANAKGEPRGTAKTRIDALLEALDAVGGLEKKQSLRLKERKIKNLISEGGEGTDE